MKMNVLSRTLLGCGLLFTALPGQAETVNRSRPSR
jgi:hypothetical protein